VPSHHERKTHQKKKDFSTETLKAMRAWNDVLQAQKENNCQLDCRAQQSCPS
jgi:hypothetical protein